MKRNKTDSRLDKSKDLLLSEFQNRLLIIKNAHTSNELMVNRLHSTAQTEQQIQVCSDLQKDMGLINDQLNVLLEKLSSAKTTK